MAVLLGDGDAVGGGGEADAVQLAEGLGEEVGAGEGGALVGDLGQHDGGDVAQDPVVEIVGGEQSVAGCRSVRLATHVSGSSPTKGRARSRPLGDEVAQGSDVLVLAGGEGGLLAQSG